MPFIQHYGCVHWDWRSPFAAETLPDPGGRIEAEWQNDACRRFLQTCEVYALFSASFA